ncbi:MAG: phosphatidylglycerophosphatase A [Acidobacteriota bacterium]
MTEAAGGAKGRAPLWALVVATGLGSGNAPVASGTFGTAACAILMFPFRGWLGPIADATIAVLLTVLAILSADVVCKAIRIKDPKIVVIDEFAGFAVTLAFLPKSWPWFLAAFFVFRALDVVKPPPCRRLEHLPGGVGIVLDDVMAGIYGCLLLHAIRFILPRLLPGFAGEWHVTAP